MPLSMANDVRKDDGFPMCNLRFDSPAQKKTRILTRVAGAISMADAGRFCSIAENAFDLDFTR